jgi:hypothetical protein
LLVGVEQSGTTVHELTSGSHGELEETIANSQVTKMGSETDGGRRAASNGGRRSSTQDDEAKLVKQIEKEEEEGLGNFQTATRSSYTSLR